LRQGHRDQQKIGRSTMPTATGCPPINMAPRSGASL
jgi:hypothetical protein